MKFTNTYSNTKALINKDELINFAKDMGRLQSPKLEDLPNDGKKQSLFKKLYTLQKNKSEPNFFFTSDTISTKQLEKSPLLTIQSKHYPSSLREWDNSIFTYNTRNLDLIPSTTNKAVSMIRGFFNYFNEKLEKSMRSKRLLKRFRRLSSHKIFLSKALFSHTNNKVLVTLYLFNRQKHNYISKLKNIYLSKLCSGADNSKKKLNFLTTLKSIYVRGLSNLKALNKQKYSLLKALNTLDRKNEYKINTFKAITFYSLSFYKKLFELSARKLRLYFLYKQLVYLNRSKLNYTYLRFLKKHLESLYNKNVDFNLINLKRFYLDSDIMCEAIKLKLTRNKRKMRKILNKLSNKVKIYQKKIFLGFFDTKKTSFTVNTVNNKNLEAFVFNNLKYKHVTGFRLQTKGRLSRRFTASRSVSKIKYNGNLLNIDSSFRGLSSVILKGNLQSNLQYTKLKSKTRIGSFGIKGWVSGN